MFIYFGTSKYGKTDCLNGLFYVVTDFFHVYHVPLVPMGSYVMIDGTNNTRGAKIGISGKSVLVGYLRCFGVLAAIICTALFALPFMEGRAANNKVFSEERILYLGIAILSVVLVVLSYYWTKPSPVRALQLAEKLGIPMEFDQGRRAEPNALNHHRLAQLPAHHHELPHVHHRVADDQVHHGPDIRELIPTFRTGLIELFRSHLR